MRGGDGGVGGAGGIGPEGAFCNCVLLAGILFIFGLSGHIIMDTLKGGPVSSLSSDRRIILGANKDRPSSASDAGEAQAVDSIKESVREEEVEADSGRGGEEGKEAGEEKTEEEDCCRGISHMELWGSVVKYGSQNKVNSSRECCETCREMCSTNSCECNSWVFCGDDKLCGAHLHECWLKMQQDVMKPDVRSLEPSVPWTSGLIHGPGQGIIEMKTTLGNIRIKLQVSWAPRTVAYIRDLVRVGYCQGCQLYRAEGRAGIWDEKGALRDPEKKGPPYALVQGTMKADGVLYKRAEKEAAPPIKRGYVALIDGGPDFFISLADHPEWGNSHSVFGTVLPEDMALVEEITKRPTKEENWDGTDVLALEDPLSFIMQRDLSDPVL